MIFGIKEKSIILINFVLLAIATNIPVRLKTGFVVQGHICIYIEVLQFRPVLTYFKTLSSASAQIFELILA